MASNNNNNMNLNMSNLNINDQQQATNNGNNLNMNNMMNPSPAIQQLAQRQMQNMNPALKEYKNQLFQQQQAMQQQNQLNMDDGGEPSDLDNTNLYIKGLWKDCTQVELDDLFKQFGVICQSRVYGDGVGFVRFETGSQAKAAIEQMDKRKLDKCQDQLLVKYAFKKQRNSKRYIRVGDEVKQYEVEMIMNKNTNNVYLRCLPRGFTEKQLTELCDPYGELTCTRLRESGVAFVRYRKAEDAQNAIRSLNGKRFDGQNETLLAKLANSDPFQPKIGFKQRPFDEEEISSVPDSTNTMTPSQGPNDAYSAHQQLQQTKGGPQGMNSHSNMMMSHQQQQHNQNKGQSQHNQQHLNTPQHHAQSLHHQSNQYNQHNQYQSHSAHPQQTHHALQSHHNHNYPPPQPQQSHYGNQYEPQQPPPQQQPLYNQYGQPIPPSYDNRGAYGHYGPPQQPAPYPHNYMNPNSAYPPQPNTPQTGPNGAANGAHPGYPAPSYYQPYPGYSAYYAPQPQPTYSAVPQQPQSQQQAVPVTPQPVTPATNQQPPSQQQAVPVASTQQAQPQSTTVTSPSTITTNTATTTATATAKAATSTQSQSQSQTPTAPTTKPSTPSKSDTNTPTTQAQSGIVKPPSILTPNISNVSATNSAAAVPTAIYVPTQVPTGANGQILYTPNTTAAVLMTAPFIGGGGGVHSPPGSELSFRHQMGGANMTSTGGPGSELSSIAARAASDIIASHHPILATNPSKVAGRTMPMTPEKTSLQTTKISPYANLPGHISPGPQNYASPAHQWQTAANSAFAVQPAVAVPVAVPAATAQPESGQIGGIEAAKQGPLVIVPENPGAVTTESGNKKDDKKPDEEKEDVSKDKLGDLPAMEQKDLGQRKTSNPHHVSKDTANKLHGVISSWYPQKAGKLTGMFLQNHDEEKVVRYLKRTDKLKKKIDTFVSLLSNQMKPTTD